MTQLCAIPSCRIRNRHLGECADDECGGCLPRVADAGYACDWCLDRAGERLATIIELAPDARLVAAGLARPGGTAGSGGKPGSRSPRNDGATDDLAEVQNTLTTLARDVAETRGQRAPRPRHLGADPIVVAARALQTQLDWLRHSVDGPEPWAIRSFAEIGDSASRMRAMVNGPSEHKYLGPCGAALVDFDFETDTSTIDTCDGDVYGIRGAQRARCRSCGAEVAQEDRVAWLDGEVRSHAFRAAHIADAYGVNVKTIRSWSARGLLRSYWRTDAGIVADWADPPEGEQRERLHYVGDVLDLAAADAVRRAEQQAKRARRAADRAADDERMSA